MSYSRSVVMAGLLLLAAAAPVLAATPPPTTATAQPEDPARRITATEARQALAKGEAVLVDVRPKESYDAEHAQGAIVIPLSEITARAGELPKDKLVITYCT